VFSDKTLIEMVNKKPKNLDEMQLISGVGQKKLFKFGNQFLKEINGNQIEKSHRTRMKMVGKPNAWLYDRIEQVINKYNRGVSGLDKPLHVSPSLILRICESQPENVSDLKDVTGMTRGILNRYGKPIIRAILSSG
jgi:ATP-dependent DNA helicase RecQ